MSQTTIDHIDSEPSEREQKLLAQAEALRANKKFLMIPASVASDRRLTLTDIVVLQNLALLIGNDKWCWPSRSLLAIMCGLNIETGKRQITRSLNNLEEYGYIRRKKQFREDGGNSSNLYQIVMEENDNNIYSDTAVTSGDNGVQEVVTEMSPHEIELKKYINNPLCVSPLEVENFSPEHFEGEKNENSAQKPCPKNEHLQKEGRNQILENQSLNKFNIIFIIKFKG